MDSRSSVLKQCKTSTKAKCLKAVNNLRKHHEEQDTVILELEVEEFLSGAGHKVPPGMAGLLARFIEEAEAEWKSHTVWPNAKRKKKGEWKEVWLKGDVKEVVLSQQRGHQSVGFRQAREWMWLHTDLKIEGQWMTKSFPLLLCHFLDRVGGNSIFVECLVRAGEEERETFCHRVLSRTGDRHSKQNCGLNCHSRPPRYQGTHLHRWVELH